MTNYYKPVFFQNDFSIKQTLKTLMFGSAVAIYSFQNVAVASTMQCNSPSPEPLIQNGWTLSANFEGESGSPAIGDNAFHSDAGYSVLSNEHSISNQAAKLTIEEGETGFGTWGGIWSLPEKVYAGETIHVSLWTYFPHGFEYHATGEGGRLKFLRLKTRNASGRATGYNDFYVNRKSLLEPFAWIYEGEQQWSWIGEPSDDIVTGVWENFQISLTLDNVSKDNGGMSEVKIWKNGQLIAHETGRRSLPAGDGGYVDAAYLFTYWNGGAPKTQSMYVDDVVITTNTPSGNDGLGNSIVPLN